MKLVKTAILIMAMCTFGLAQDKTADKKPAAKSAMTHDHDMPGGFAPAKPNPGMEKVLSTVGTWSATIKNEPSPWSPKGSTDKGMMVVTKGPGGLSVIQDFRSKGAMGEYHGHGIIYWDTVANQQASIWCDNMSGCATGMAKMEGDNGWTSDMNNMFQGKKMKMVSHGKILDGGNSMHEEFTQSIDGGPMNKIMTIDYKRSGKAMTAKD
jgi:hypothetical protein